MKRLMMVIAAVIGLGLGFAHAEVTMDFDGRTIGTFNFREAINTAKEKSCECHEVCDSNKKCTTVCTCSNTNTVSDLAAVPAPIPVKVESFDMKGEEDELNRSIGTAIKDCEKKGFVVLKTKFEKLLTEGIPQEKHDFVYNTKQTYEIPRRMFIGTDTAAATKNLQDGTKSSGACVASHTEQHCIDRNVCHTVCTAGQLVCYAVPGGAPYCGPGAAVCNLICAIVPECTTSTVCDSWLPYPNTHNGDSIDDNGNVIAHR